MIRTCLCSVVMCSDRLEQRQTTAVVDQRLLIITGTECLVAFVLLSLGFHLLQLIAQPCHSNNNETLQMLFTVVLQST